MLRRGLKFWVMMSGLCVSHAYGIQSLMFTNDDVQTMQLQRHHDRQKDAMCLRCTGYLFVSPKSWRIKLNHQWFSKADLVARGYEIISVDAGQVNLKIEGQSVSVKPGVSWRPDHKPTD